MSVSCVMVVVNVYIYIHSGSITIWLSTQKKKINYTEISNPSVRLTRVLTYRRHWGYSLPWWPRWMQRLLVAGRSKRCHWAVDTGRAWGQRAAHSHLSRCCWHWCAGFWRPAAGCWDPWSDLVERKSTRQFFMILLCSGGPKKSMLSMCKILNLCIFFCPWQYSAVRSVAFAIVCYSCFDTGDASARYTTYMIS